MLGQLNDPDAEESTRQLAQAVYDMYIREGANRDVHLPSSIAELIMDSLGEEKRMSLLRKKIIISSILFLFSAVTRRKKFQDMIRRHIHDHVKHNT